MEKKSSQNRKRTRDEGSSEKYNKHESRKGKRHVEITTNIDSLYKEKGVFDEFYYDGKSVFDFPWLKEGKISNIDEYLDPEDSFTWFWKLLDDSFAATNGEIETPAILFAHDDGNMDEDAISCNWSSLKIDEDDLQPNIDSIWSSVIDQPLDIGWNKLS